MNKIPFIILIFYCVGCGLFKPARSSSNEPSPASNRAADSERLKKFSELEERKVELSTVPKEIRLTKEPYVTGKVLFLQTISSQPPMLMNTSQVPDPYSPPPGPLETDILIPMMATRVDEVGTVILIESDVHQDGCKEVEKKLYKTKDGKFFGGYVQVCELTIIDRSIPAVIFKRKFEGKLRDKEYAREDEGYILAKVERKDIYDFLASLPRR